MEMFLKILLVIAVFVGGGLLWGWLSTDLPSGNNSSCDDFYHGPDPTDDFDDGD